MALYHDAARLVEQRHAPLGSLKTRVFGTKGLSAPKRLYALLAQASKWSAILSGVVERAELLRHERRHLSPALAVLLVHDLLLAPAGVAAPAAHPLRAAVERHRARLGAELVRARVRAGYASLDAWREAVERDAAAAAAASTDGARAGVPRPRWVRVNALQTTLAEELRTSFADYQRVDTLAAVLAAGAALPAPKLLHVDRHVPGLLALPAATDLTAHPAYRAGRLILQDKASCLPALLLDPATLPPGPLLDACAAPGNKTTHLAALQRAAAVGAAAGTGPGAEPAEPIYACERDPARAATLRAQLARAGAGAAAGVEVRAGQDFLWLRPDEPPWRHVRGVLVDPSCSGSGIVGRDETFAFTLPRAAATDDDPGEAAGRSPRKRKRGGASATVSAAVASEGTSAVEAAAEEHAAADPPPVTPEAHRERLAALAALQTKLLLHALRFPAAERVVYSTCSVHTAENEQVVARALDSAVARERGWRLLRRDEQVAGLRAWDRRGALAGFEGASDAAARAEACVRCERGTAEGTQGFFVAGFVREGGCGAGGGGEGHRASAEASSADEEPWEGFAEE